MDDFEPWCHICGISFNVGRYPTFHEIVTGMRNAQWLQNTHLLEGWRESACTQDCFVATLTVERAGAHCRVQAQSTRRFDGDTPYRGRQEHVAGPDCQNLAGYNGNVVSPEEIKGCCTSQFLVPKPIHPVTILPRDELLGDQEQFEADGDFRLSGLADHMPRDGLLQMRDIHPPPGRPIPAINGFRNGRDAGWGAMPFHPTCLEVYKRASIRRFGFIDIQGLTDWFCLEADHDIFYEAFPRHPCVKEAQRKSPGLKTPLWLHNPGSEWLVANPCFVPALPSILDSAIRKKEFAIDQGSPLTGGSTTSDPFGRLPIEICLGIAERLDARGLACARQVSRAFHDLPQFFYQGFITRNYPWLWEAWCEIPFAFWAGNEKWELKEKDDAWRARKLDLQAQKDSLSLFTHERLSEIRDVEVCLEKELAEYKKTRDPIPAYTLPKELHAVDWHALYLNLSNDPTQLKGLKNRKRIWTQCVSILDRIEHYRATDQMGPSAPQRPFDLRRQRVRDYARRRRNGERLSAWTDGTGGQNSFVQVSGEGSLVRVSGEGSHVHIGQTLILSGDA